MHANACTHTHTVVAVQVSAIRWLPTVMARSAGIHSRVIQINTRAGTRFPRCLECFSRIKKAVLRRKLVTGCITVRRYKQLETSPKTIEQELRPAVCEHRQT